MAASFVIAAKFMAAQRTTSVSTASVSTASVGAPVAQLCALHNQCRQQAAQEDQFDVGGDKPTAWLDWEAVQGVRVAAEDSLCSATTKAERLKLTRDVAVLRMLADQPPDRVGVLRTLKLGGSLKRKPDGSYELDLSVIPVRTRPLRLLVPRALVSTRALRRGWTITSRLLPSRKDAFYSTLPETSSRSSRRLRGPNVSRQHLLGISLPAQVDELRQRVRIHGEQRLFRLEVGIAVGRDRD